MSKAGPKAELEELVVADAAEQGARKLGEFVAMLARHEAIHPQKARPEAPPPPA